MSPEKPEKTVPGNAEVEHPKFPELSTLPDPEKAEVSELVPERTELAVPEIAEVTVSEFPEQPTVPDPENVEAPEKAEPFPRVEIGRKFPTVGGRLS